MRIAWFSALNVKKQSSSKSAFFSDQILPLIKAQDAIKIDLFHDGSDIHDDFPTYHYLSAFEHHRHEPYDLFFYQLEDHPCSSFARLHLGLVPGVVLFHDIYFTYHPPEPIHRSPFKSIVDKYRASGFADPSFWEWDDQFTLGDELARREASYALVALFSTQRHLGEFRRNCVDRLVDHGQQNLFHLPAAVDFDHLSTKGFSARSRNILYGGAPRIECRTHKLLEAISEIDCNLIWLIEPSEKAEAEDLLREFNVSKCEIIIGRTPYVWQDLVSKGSVAVHSLFSIHGGVSPYFQISLASGIPVLLTNFGESEFLPQGLVYRVQPGDQEAQEFAAIISQVLANGLGNSVQLKYANEFLDRRVVTTELMNVFKNSRSLLSDNYSRWQLMQSAASRCLKSEAIALKASSDMSELKLAEKFEAAYADLGWSA